MKHIFKSKKAFTLIELLVVIAVMGLLSSIVFVSLRGARDKAIIARKIEQSTPFHSMLGANLVGEWKFNEEIGEFKDTSGNSNHFNLMGGITRPESFHPEFGLAAKGPDNGLGYVSKKIGVSEVANNPLNLGGGNVSIASWVRFDRDVVSGKIFCFNCYIDDSHRYHLKRENDKIYMIIGDYISPSRTGNLDQGVWYFVVGTYNHRKKSLSIYVDGIREVHESGLSITNEMWAPHDRSESVYIAAIFYLNGSMDDLRIYSEAFTEAQVKKMYAEAVVKREIALD